MSIPINDIRNFEIYHSWIYSHSLRLYQCVSVVALDRNIEPQELSLTILINGTRKILQPSLLTFNPFDCSCVCLKGLCERVRERTLKIPPNGEHQGNVRTPIFFIKLNVQSI
jgi:hypothetical protein